MNQGGDVLRERLKWLMAIRLVFATFLLGATILMGGRGSVGLGHPTMSGLWGLIGLTYFLTLPYVWLLRKMRDLRALAWVQIMGDLILETLLVYFTGVEESGFSSIYNLSIITGSILMSSSGGLSAASLSGLLYGGVLDLRYYEVLPVNWLAAAPVEPVASTPEIFYKVIVNVSAFFLVAFLSSYLAEQVRISKEELQEAKSDLSDLAAIHQEILECLTSGLITADLQGHINFANKASSIITGLSRDRLTRMSLFGLFPELLPRRGDTIKVHTRRVMDYIHPSGKGMKIGYSIAPLKKANGKEVGIILHFQDLTDAMRLEEDLRTLDRMAAVGEMAARIAHEIRNPLASLSGSIQMLSRELSLEGQERRLMEIVLKESGRLNSLLTDFLLYARPGKPQPQWVDIEALLREVFRLASEEGRDEVRGELRLSLEQGFSIRSDPQKIKQVLWNLINNAFEALKGGGSFVLEARAGNGKGQHQQSEQSTGVLIGLEDTGPGIPPDQLTHIFDPFFTTKEKGTGLGLSIVHRIVQELRGSIEVKSQLGQGTRFEVWLPSMEEEQ